MEVNLTQTIMMMIVCSYVETLKEVFRELIFLYTKARENFWYLTV